MATHPSKKFDLNFVFLELKSCYEKTNKLDMDCYLRAYTEFNKFFGLMGTVFGFVSSDVTSKLQILQEFRVSPQGNNFETIEDMILYEEKENLLNNPKYVSGCRTLLRLHRALIFIALFLEEIHKVSAHDRLASHCQNAYRSTLATYHPWLIQKAAIVAMYALPTKEGLLNRIKSPDESVEYYENLLPSAVAAMKEIHQRTEKLYQDHNLLDLP